jgi:hypothetical protein
MAKPTLASFGATAPAVAPISTSAVAAESSKPKRAAKRHDLAVTTIRLDSADLERLRIEAIRNKSSLQAIIEEGLNLWCAKHGVKEIRATCSRY